MEKAIAVEWHRLPSARFKEGGLDLAEHLWSSGYDVSLTR